MLCCSEVWSEVAELVERVDRVERLLLLRPSLRIEPKRERVVEVGSGVRPHAVEVGIVG